MDWLSTLTDQIASFVGGVGNLVFGGISLLITLYFVLVIIRHARITRANRVNPPVAAAPVPPPTPTNGDYSPSRKALVSVVALIGAIISIAYLGYIFRGSDYYLGQTIWTVELIYLALSFRIIGPEDIGAVIFLGIPVVNVSSGPVIVPFLICELVLAPRTLIQKEFPAEQDKIYRGDEPIVPPGMFPPTRITFAEGPAGNNDPLNLRVTQEVILVGAFKIRNLCQFLTAYGSVDEMLRQVEDTMVGQATDDLSVISLAEALRRKDHYSQRIKSALETRIQDVRGGVHVMSALIKGFVLSHDLNIALQAHAEARGKASAAVTTAEATRTTLTLEGEGAANATRARIAAELEGRTRGLREMADQLKVDGSEVLAAETARGVASTGSTIVVGTDGFTDLLGLAKAMAGKKP